MKTFCLSILVIAVSVGAVCGADLIPAPMPLTLAEAENLAMANHPRISAAELRALAARQSALQARSAFFPTVIASATAVQTGEENARISAGSLSNPGIYDRQAEGIFVTQLLTDFGRTANLNASAKLRAGAEKANSDVVRAEVLLLTDSAFFESLRAESVLNVSTQTLATRQVLLDYVTAMATNKLKSELDLSFAKVSLDEAWILALQATNEVEAAQTRLAMLAGLDESTRFTLRDESMPDDKTVDISDIINTALASRPDLKELHLEGEALQKFARAEHAARYPTISAMGAFGFIPIHDSHFDDDYEVAGINMSVPLFAGGFYAAREREAKLKAESADKLWKARQDEVIRDVRIASLGVKTARERINVAGRLLEHAVQTYNLAQTKYSVGESSIVELSQAQLSRTMAEIEAATARYNYQLQLVTLKFQAGILAPREPGPSQRR